MKTIDDKNSDTTIADQALEAWLHGPAHKRVPPLPRDIVETLPILADEPCLKCGCLGPSLKWCGAGDGQVIYDWMEVECWKCRFVWYRRPKDAKVNP